MDLPFSRLVTRTSDGMGSVRWAALTSSMSKISPLAVRSPWNWGPCHEAMPVSEYFGSSRGT